jgi:hypothetical protein
MTAIGSTPEAAAQFFQSELTKYARLVSNRGNGRLTSAAS